MERFNSYLISFFHAVNRNEFGIMQTRQDVTHVIANLQRQRVNGRCLASEYLECNTDLLGMLLPG